MTGLSGMWVAEVLQNSENAVDTCFHIAEMASKGGKEELECSHDQDCSG